MPRTGYGTKRRRDLNLGVVRATFSNSSSCMPHMYHPTEDAVATEEISSSTVQQWSIRNLAARHFLILRDFFQQMEARPPKDTNARRLRKERLCRLASVDKFQDFEPVTQQAGRKLFSSFYTSIYCRLWTKLTGYQTVELVQICCLEAFGCFIISMPLSSYK